MIGTLVFEIRALLAHRLFKLAEIIEPPLLLRPEDEVQQ